MTRFLILALLLLASPALADEYDYLAGFPDQATAQADPVWAPKFLNADGSWRADLCMSPQVFNGTVDGNGNLVPLPGFFLWCAEPILDTALNLSNALLISADRDAALAGQPFILVATIPQSTLDTFTISPQVAGTKYPFGNVSP